MTNDETSNHIPTNLSDLSEEMSNRHPQTNIEIETLDHQDKMGSISDNGLNGELENLERDIVDFNSSALTEISKSKGPSFKSGKKYKKHREANRKVENRLKPKFLNALLHKKSYFTVDKLMKIF